MQGQTVIFIHIPKAAGSTLRAIIQNQYKRHVMYAIDGRRVKESVEEFKILPLSHREKIRVLLGHMLFGLHEYIPRPSTYITILRDPVERVISNYYYVLRKPAHRMHDEVTSQKMTLKEYVESKINTQLNNGQTRVISGINDVLFGKCTNEMFERAKKNIENHFSVVGLTERFDETLILLQRVLAWRRPFYIMKNVTKNRPVKENISEDTLNTIEYYNKLDIALYKFAKERFEEDISRQSLFKVAVITFRYLNRLCACKSFKHTLHGVRKSNQNFYSDQK